MSQNIMDHEYQVKKVKKYLEGWRVVLLPLKSILMWEQQWHPCAILGAVTSIYVTLWLLDLNTLSTVAAIGLLFNFIDFIIPIISKTIYGPTQWTGQKEKMFEDICTSIVLKYNAVMKRIGSFYSLREVNPTLYHVTSISLMLLLAWISSTVNNIFLFYILSITMLLWPGLQHRGIFNMISVTTKKNSKAE